MVRWSDDDYATNSWCRAGSGAENARLRQCGSFRRRSFELMHVGESAVQVAAPELDVTKGLMMRDTNEHGRLLGAIAARGRLATATDAGQADARQSGHVASRVRRMELQPDGNYRRMINGITQTMPAGMLASNPAGAGHAQQVSNWRPSAAIPITSATEGAARRATAVRRRQHCAADKSMSSACRS